MMSVRDHIAFLQRFPLFASFKKEHLQLVAFNIEKTHLQKNDILFNESDKADYTFIVTSGMLELTYLTADKNNSLIFIKPFQMVDETALIVKNIMRKNTARAVEKTHILKISQAFFKRFLSEHPELIPPIYEYYKNRLYKTEALITHFSEQLQK